MPFDLDDFVRLRPMSFHLTARENLELIQATMRLHSAAALMEAAGDTSFLRRRRPEAHRLQRDGATVAVLRDQAPLYEGNVALEGDWAFDDLVQSLNERVFFWPGTGKGPSAYGRRHFARYRDEGPVVLCIPTAALFEGNDAPEFCKYNSGSPRWSGGVASQRGPETFVDSDNATFRASKVVEVTFSKGVALLRDACEVRPVADFLN